MIREILKMGDERLLRVAQPVPDEMFDTPELWQLLDDMLQTMEHAGGVGLAAPQIGVDLQLVVFGFEHSERYPDAEPPYALRGAFRVGVNAGEGIDGASETDGLEVTSANLGGPWSKGMLVVQDGRKRMPEQAQNFKYIPWAEVAKALHLP